MTAATHTQRGDPPLPPSNTCYKAFKREGLNNYVVQYDDQFYRGGNLVVEDLVLEAFEELGVKTVISIVPDDGERAFCSANGFGLVEIPFSKDRPSEANYLKFFEALETAPAPYYVHCKGGSHRAGILGAAYRMRMSGWTFEKAVVEYGRLGGDLRADHAMIETLHFIPADSKVTRR